MKDICEYTRVTDVLFPLSGLRNIDPTILKNAAERGTKVHNICDAVIDGLGIGKIDQALFGYVESFNQWLPKHFIEKPKRFFCDEHKITGECDAIYEESDGLVLVDFKTPANESKTWKLQGSAYSYLAKQSGYDIKRIEFVKLSKTGSKPKVFVYEEDFDMFLKCLDIYRYFFNKNLDENPLDYL